MDSGLWNNKRKEVKSVFDLNNILNIPRELKEVPNFIVWKYVSGKGKIPFSLKNNKLASVSDPLTWSSWSEIESYLKEKRNDFDGIGFVFTEEKDICGIDLDNVRDPLTGKLLSIARTIIEKVNSYAEVSPSGTGVHILCRAKDLTLKWNKKPLFNEGYKDSKMPAIEIYTSSRYFTITGKIINKCTLNQCSNELKELINEYSDKYTNIITQLVEKVKLKVGNIKENTGLKDNSKTMNKNTDLLNIGLEKDDKLRSLWDGTRPHKNESSDDLALMDKLAYWCNCDENEMLNAFINSPYFAGKDEKHKAKWLARKDYSVRTISEAINKCVATAMSKERLSLPKQVFEKLAEEQSTKLIENMEYVPDLLNYGAFGAGDVDRFMFMYGSSVRFVDETKAWYIWDGQRWKIDRTLGIWRLGLKLSRLYAYAAGKQLSLLKQEKVNKPSLKVFNRTVQYAQSRCSYVGIKAMLELVKAQVSVDISMFDTQTYLLNCLNGTVDLRTGKLRAHNKENYITKLVEENYDPNATAPVFDKFLNDIMCEKKEMIDTLMILLGYFTTGETKYQYFFFFNGDGSNGKSTLVALIGELIKDYTQIIPADVIMQNRHTGGATPELSRARSMRWLIINESNEAQALNESRVKSLTGGDTIAVRALYTNGGEYLPQHKMLMLTNNLPDVKTGGDAFWRRAFVVPFNAKFEGNTVDLNMPVKLRVEYSGILSKLVKAAVQYYRNGLFVPSQVEEATAKYKSENDVVGGFVSACLEKRRNSTIQATKLYKIFQKYCLDNGYEVISQTAFGRKMKEEKIVKRKDGIGIICYQDICLTEQGEAYEEDYAKHWDERYR